MRSKTRKNDESRSVSTISARSDLLLEPERQLLVVPQLVVLCKCNPEPNALTPINAFNGDAGRCASALLWRDSPILLFLPTETALNVKASDGSWPRHS